MLDVLIRGATVVDGTGGPSRRADVAVEAGRVTEVGTVEEPAHETVDAEGLVFEGSGRRFEAKWAQVTDYFVASLPARLSFGVRYVVVTPSGSFDFTPLLRDARILTRVIVHYAKNALAADWRARTDDVLGGAASRRSANWTART